MNLSRLLRSRYMAISIESSFISAGTVMMDPSPIPRAYAATFDSLLSGGVVTSWLTDSANVSKLYGVTACTTSFTLAFTCHDTMAK